MSDSAALTSATRLSEIILWRRREEGRGEERSSSLLIWRLSQSETHSFIYRSDGGGWGKKTSLPFSRFSSLFSPSRHLVETFLKGSSREDNEQVIARHLVVEITDSVRDPSCQGAWPRLLPHIHVCKTLMGSRPLAIQVCVVMQPEGHRWGGHAPDGESLSVSLSVHLVASHFPISLFHPEGLLLSLRHCQSVQWSLTTGAGFKADQKICVYRQSEKKWWKSRWKEMLWFIKTHFKAIGIGWGLRSVMIDIWARLHCGNPDDVIGSIYKRAKLGAFVFANGQWTGRGRGGRSLFFLSKKTWRY